MEEYKFPSTFLEAVQAEECILFVGSGFSVWSGLPTWTQLLDRMVAFLERQGINADDQMEITNMISRGELLSAAGLCRLLMRPGDFADFVYEVFIAPNVRPHEIHELVVDLPPKCFITTNYDRLLDDAFQRVHDGLVLRPVNNNQVPEQAQIQKHGASHFVFTPHGRAESVETLVLTSEDYRALRNHSQPTVDAMRTLLISRPVIYLGFGLRDPDFLLIKDDIAATYQGGERGHFAIMPDVGQLERRYWREQYGVHILSYDTLEISEGKDRGAVSHEGLLNLLRSLRARLKEGSEPRKAPTDHGLSERSVSARASSVLRYCNNIIYAFGTKYRKTLSLTASAETDSSLHPRPDNGFRQQSLKAKERNVPILDVLDGPNNLLLLGAPGSGKTYAVNLYAATLAERAVQALKTERANVQSSDYSVPLVLPMKEYTGNVLEMMSLRLPKSLNVQEMLRQGSFTVIFDAVNEVPRPLIETKALSNDLVKLVDEFPASRYIFTTRSMNYLPPLDMPSYRLDPLSKGSISAFLTDQEGDVTQEMSRTAEQLLSTPLFLALFSRVRKKLGTTPLKAVTLLKRYFLEIHRKLPEAFKTLEISLEQVFAPLAYEMLELGTQTTTFDEMLRHLANARSEGHRLGTVTARLLAQISVSEGLLVLDAEGHVGFFHQTVLEYLAALQLRQLYETDSTILDEKFSSLRWDETIVVFASLLPEERAAEVLQRIARFDVLFASRAFEFGAYRDETTGLHLFDLIVSDVPQKTEVEKKDIATAIKSIGRYGRASSLVTLLDDETLGGTAALVLAQMQAVEQKPRMINRLIEENVYPSDFARALKLLVDESDIAQLIDIGVRLESSQVGGLADWNLTSVLATLESDNLYREITKLIESGDPAQRRFAGEILQRLASDGAEEYLFQLLLDSDPGIRVPALFYYMGFGGPEFFGGKQPSKSDRVVERMFELLGDEESGHFAAKYLQRVADQKIVNRARDLLNATSSKHEWLNLCTVIANSDPDLIESAVFASLEDYEAAYNDEYLEVLRALGSERVLPRIYSYIGPDNLQLSALIIDRVLSWSIAPGSDRKLPADTDTFVKVLRLWENHDIGHLRIADFAVAHTFLLDRLNNAAYPYRDRLIEPVSRLKPKPSREQVTLDTIDWLITRIDFHRRSSVYPAAMILGSVCDETMVEERLLPLLRSENSEVRAGAHVAISKAEKAIGKRFMTF